jgi:molecular chaperone GrpE (heat shock protein)
LNLVNINSNRSYSTKRQLLNRINELEQQNKELTSKLNCLEEKFINLNKKNMEIIKKYKKILL